MLLVTMDINGNENCLEGLRCPACGEYDMLLIEVRTVIEITDEGTGDFGDTEWDENSYCECSQCTYHGKVADFRIDPPKKKVQPEEEISLTTKKNAD